MRSWNGWWRAWAESSGPSCAEEIGSKIRFPRRGAETRRTTPKNNLINRRILRLCVFVSARYSGAALFLPSTPGFCLARKIRWPAARFAWFFLLPRPHRLYAEGEDMPKRSRPFAHRYVFGLTRALSVGVFLLGLHFLARIAAPSAPDEAHRALLRLRGVLVLVAVAWYGRYVLLPRARWSGFRWLSLPVFAGLVPRSLAFPRSIVMVLPAQRRYRHRRLYEPGGTARRGPAPDEPD